ncbi:MAG TPA: hypothetical protein VFI31_01160 [Pirellulales bacterium]|nr:hypothetical protein [Pirellulales bacterium]
MTPLWKIRSGKFAGWYSNDALYDERGRWLGFLAGAAAYAKDGGYLGEIFEVEWIGRSPGEHAPQPGLHSPGENLAHAPLADRQGRNLPDWEDPGF